MKSDVTDAPAASQRSASANWAVGLGWAVAVCLMTTGLALPLRGALAEANLVLIYLLAVGSVTLRFGRPSGIFASFLAVLSYDVFMVPPYFSLTVDEPQYLLTFAIMLSVSLLLSHLTANLQLQAQIAQQREHRASALFELSKALSGALNMEQVSDIAVRCSRVTFHAPAVLLFPNKNGALASLEGTSEPPLRLSDTVLIVAKLVFEREVTSGDDAPPTMAAGVQCLPLRAPMRTRGVLVLVPPDSSRPIAGEQIRMLQACAAQIALAIERLHYSEVAHETMLSMESERLRNVLLNAMSHDVRTPLTSIIGLSSTLACGPAISERTTRELGQAIFDAATRMNKLVTDLLDMARIHDGAIQLNLQWQLLEEVIGSALADLAPKLYGLRVDVSVPPTLPLIQFDGVLLERVIVNLVDNAIKHGAAGGAICIDAYLIGDKLEVAVSDRGAGIKADMQEAIFAKFVRDDPPSPVQGLGLGLAICKAIVTAHGGTIRAENQDGGGARFVFTLPVGTPPSDEELE